MQNTLHTFDGNGLQVTDLALEDVATAVAMAEMATVLAHEINNPLQGLTNQIYLAKAGLDHSNTPDFASNLAPNLDRLSSLTSKLLTVTSAAMKRKYSKGRRGSPIPDRTTVLERNNVRVLGHGPETIVFAHGFGCNQEMWRSVAPAFLSDYTVVLFDHIGAGASNSAAFDRIRHSTLQGYIQDVLDILEVLELQGVHFVGHSVSGMIGALASITDPELFANLIMISPSPRYINDGEYIGGFEQHDIEGLLEVLSSNYLGWSMTMAPAFMANEHNPELAKELELSFCKVDPLIAHHFAQVIFLSDFRAELSKIRTRTLILQPQEDVVVPVAVGEYVHRSIPNSRLVILDATGHYPHLSAPGEVIQAVKQFLTPSQSDPSR